MKKIYLFILSFFTITSVWSQCCSNGVNLLANYNPDFSAPFVSIPPGFITDNPYTTIPTPGTYIIVSARNYGACGNSPQFDHTSGDPINGSFLWFDTSPTASLVDPDIAWQPFDSTLPVGSQSLISVAPNATYVFSCWIRDLAREPDCISGGAPLMGLRINGQQLSIVDLALVTSPCCPEWTYLCSEWSSGSDTTALIQIESLRADGFNDLGIDDVYFGTTSPFDFSLGADTSLCLGASIVLSDTTTNSLNVWSNGSTSSQIQVTTPGVYWLEVTKNNCIKRDSINVIQVFPPSINLGSDTTICNQTPLTILPANTGGDIVNYLWQNTVASNNFTINSSGLYWLEASNSCGSSTDSIVVDFFNPPALGNDTSACIGSIISLNIDTADSYLWSTGETNPIINVNTSGVYWVETIVGACLSRDSISVSFQPPPSINLGPDTTICNQAPLTILPTNTGGDVVDYLWQNAVTSNNFTINSSGLYWLEASNSCGSSTDSIVVNFFNPPALGNDTSACIGSIISLNIGPADSYLWSTGETNPIINVSTSGVYWVETIFDECIARDSIEITFLSIPFTDLGEDSSYCDKNFITLTASPADAYLWSDGSSLASINVSSSGVFWVEASNGNCAFRDSVKLAFNTTPILELGNDTTICQGEFITLTSAMGTSYLWSNGASSSSISVSTAGLYWLELNNESCFIRDSLTLSIDPCDIIVEFPNVFTPNGDGVNDIFLPIELEGIENGKLTIVNRWGLQVFFTENLLHGWDGTANGKSCNDGTYFWIFEYSNVKGETKNITGFVALTGN